MIRVRYLALAAAPLALAACERADEARGVDHGETLLSVSASGQAESRPDRAQFRAGIETFSQNATSASEANAGKIAEIVAALRELGVAEDNIQTQSVNVGRIEYGDREGQYRAMNVVEVTMDDPGRAGAIKLRGVYHLTPVDKGGQVVKVEDIKERDIMSAPKLDTDPTDAHTNHASI